MDHTLEVRWFYPGTPPSALVDWITDLGATQESVRTDLYLVSDDPAMNVKLREGKVQTKHRLNRPVPCQFSPSVGGHRERWVKWSFGLNGSHDLLDEDPTGLWVPVHKDRLQLSLEPDEVEDIVGGAIDPETTEAAMELTTVSAEGSSAWSLCIESEGRPAGLSGTLDRAGDVLLQDCPHPLDDEHSFGYARWIRAEVS